MYKSKNDISTTRDVDIVIRKVKEEITKEDLFQKLTGRIFFSIITKQIHNTQLIIVVTLNLQFSGLKLVIILQVALTSFAILIWANRCRVKSKRRRHR